MLRASLNASISTPAAGCRSHLESDLVPPSTATSTASTLPSTALPQCTGGPRGHLTVFPHKPDCGSHPFPFFHPACKLSWKSKAGNRLHERRAHHDEFHQRSADAAPKTHTRQEQEEPWLTACGEATILAETVGN